MTAPIPPLVSMLAGIVLFAFADWLGTKLEFLSLAAWEQHCALILAAGAVFLATGMAGIWLVGLGLSNAVERGCFTRARRWLRLRYLKGRRSIRDDRDGWIV